MTSKAQAVLDAAIEWDNARYRDVSRFAVERAEDGLNHAVQSYLAEKEVVKEFSKFLRNYNGDNSAEKSNDVCATCKSREKIWLGDTANTVPCPTCQKNAEKGNIAPMPSGMKIEYPRGCETLAIQVVLLTSKLNEVINKMEGGK